MKRCIITDSACDLNEHMEKEANRIRVPFVINIGEKSFLDDGSIDQAELISAMQSYQGVPRTAAPGPYEFARAYEDSDESFVVTISAQLSATYANAMLAKQMLEEKSEALVHVFNSRSAASGETLTYLRIKEFMDQGLKFDEIVAKVEDCIKRMRTIFVLDSVDNLMKNGRMSKIAGFFANVLSIKPVLYADENGEIKLLDKARGIKKAHQRMIEIIGEDCNTIKERIMVIAHCNALEAAIRIKEEIQRRYSPKEIHLVETEGLTTIYTDDGGIVIAY